LKFLLLAGALAVRAGAAEQPKRYECHRAGSAIVGDGRMSEQAWRGAAWSDWFVDIRGGRFARPRFRTRVRMLWDDKYLYAGAQMEEPNVWATLTQHDSVIFHDNDFEVFLNPRGDGLRYFEFEMNALNTGWDLLLAKPYLQGGKADNGWDIPGLLTGVAVEGTLNDARDRDRGWSVELAFPLEAFTERSGVSRPKRGEEWRMNFSRVEWRVRTVNGKTEKVTGLPEDNLVWSPQGVVNMHVPERWGFVRFVD
jgi:hypothetical protein